MLATADSPPSSVPERRERHRVPVLETSGLQLRAWKIPPGAPLSARPMPSTEFKVTAKNISVGGVLAIRDGSKSFASRRDRLRILITYEGLEAILEARVCSEKVLENGSVAASMQFVTRQNSVDSRRVANVLAKIVATVEREALRDRFTTSKSLPITN